MWRIKKQETKREKNRISSQRYNAKKKAQKEAEWAREFKKMKFSKEDILILAEKEMRREKKRLYMREKRAREKVKQQMAEEEKEKRKQLRILRKQEKLLREQEQQEKIERRRQKDRERKRRAKLAKKAAAEQEVFSRDVVKITSCLKSIKV